MKHKRRVLVAVTGMSPQILTETVYTLYTQQNWLPDEIFVLTTQIGYNNIVHNLLGKDGFFTRLCNDYKLPEIQFGEKNIHVIHDADGEKLSDIRTPEDNNLAADMIVNFIRQQCADDKTELHVSIAGGRKSMGFYIGYALSLFGRPQDKLSHVLVTEGFENNPLFFYPTNYDNYISKKPNDPNCTETINTREAKVMLAEIPFVRISYGLPDLKQDNNSFSQTITAIQDSLNNGKLVLKMTKLDSKRPKFSLICGGQEVSLSQQHFCVYWTMAEFAKRGRTLTLPDDKAAYDHLGDGTFQDYDDWEELYWEHYLILNPKLRNTNQRNLEKSAREIHRDLQKRLPAIFREVVSRTKSKLTKKLGEHAAKRYGIKSYGKRKSLTYTFNIPADWIEIIQE